MSSPVRARPRTGSPSRPPAPRGPRPRDRGSVLRRRRVLLLGVIGAVAIVAALTSPVADKAVQEIALPLRHEDIIRQQAADKDLDPALIAAVIYQESRFRDGQTSEAGAKGLMQLLPATATYIARLSGGTAFESGDLATPQVNIAYGAYYLRYLERKYRGSDALALAAYNAGEGKVDGWLADSSADGTTFDPGQHIPFPETRNYVRQVLDARREYRRQYRSELGL